MKKLKNNPWLNMLYRPRVTISDIVSNCINHRIFVLYWLSGFFVLYSFLQSIQFSASKGVLILVLLLISGILGYLQVNILSACYLATGKLLGGKASFKEIRAAICWSHVPMVALAVAALLIIASMGSNVFELAQSDSPSSTQYYALFFSFSFLNTVTSIWSFVLFLQALGQVQGYSAWMALLNLLLIIIAIGIIIFLISLLGSFIKVSI